MRTSVERLRIGLLAGAGLLVLVIAGFLGYARYRVHRALADLPGRLGATISKEFNGWTFSQSDGKKTIFTIHASKAVEHKDGLLTLHDVNMVLYGKKGDRADRISGDDFEYNTKDEVIRALGIVHLDLEAPVAEGTQTSDAAKHLGGAATVHDDAGVNSRVIHVKTSGLVYMKKLGVAATAQGIEFAFGGFTGHAVGAEYDSDTGHLVLQSAVTASGLDRSGRNGGRPVAMSASHGELDRGSEVAEFSDARYNSAGQTAQADTARIHLRGDGTVEGVEGVGRVALAEAGHGAATSDRATVSLDTTNKPKAAVLTGRVHFAEDDPLRQVSGESDTAQLTFDAQGNLDHSQLRSHVRTLERQPGRDGAPWQERSLTADDLDLTLASASSHEKPLLRDAKATGSAHLTNVATVSKSALPAVCGDRPIVSGRCFVTTTDKLSGDVIQAHFIESHGIAEPSTLHAAGHTVVEQLSTTGVDQVSFGDTLDATFRRLPGTDGGANNPAKEGVELASVVQQGDVAVTRSSPRKSKAGAPGLRDVQHETARMARYDADAGTLTLTGDVRMNETGSTLIADRVVMERDSHNATADGAIKATYLQTGPQISCAQRNGSTQPVHILAARAELNHDAGRATFYGRPAVGGSGTNSGLARLWLAGAAGQGGAQEAQGGSQIEAPVLVFEQGQGRLTARAEEAGVSGQVHVALPYAERARPSGAVGKDAEKAVLKITAKPEPTPSRQGVARITSSQMVYSDIDRQASFTGGVRLLDRNGDIRAQQATVFLRPASAGKEAASKDKNPARNDSSHEISNPPCSNGADPSGPGPNGAVTLSGAPGVLGGNVERIVATQHVEITQPGREASGERLVYTASDQMYLLTGTAAVPPKVVDAVQGTTTGAAIRFNFGGSGDQSVVVSGRDVDAPARKVHTETRVKQ